MNATLRNARIITALLFLAAGLITVWQSRSLPFGSLKAIKAGFFPQTFGALLIFLSVVMLIQQFAASRRRAGVAPQGAEPGAGEQDAIAQTTAALQQEAEQEQGETTDIRSFLIFVAVLVAFVTVVYFAGFIAGSLVSVLGVGYLLGLKGWRLWLLTVSVPCVTWLLFDYTLGLSLPVGIWFG